MYLTQGNYWVDDPAQAAGPSSRGQAQGKFLCSKSFHMYTPLIGKGACVSPPQIHLCMLCHRTAVYTLPICAREYSILFQAHERFLPLGRMLGDKQFWAHGALL